MEPGTRVPVVLVADGKRQQIAAENPHFDRAWQDTLQGQTGSLLKDTDGAGDHEE
ncbi:hypothetical protein OHB13_36655 [Streptomyces sp. NBC_00440]|uniref:hypothetical protein n=1 Tax=Streptomyces sp. NBC_00440 TaxID=2975741 RepID=UPI002E2061EA